MLVSDGLDIGFIAFVSFVFPWSSHSKLPTNAKDFLMIQTSMHSHLSIDGNFEMSNLS